MKRLTDLNIPEISYDDFNSTFTIPLIFSANFKKISWSETNKSTNILTTLITKVVTRGIDKYFDMSSNETIELMEDIFSVNFRVNDEIVDDSLVSRDNLDLLRVSKKYPLSKYDQCIGSYQISRFEIKDMLVDLSTDQSM